MFQSCRDGANSGYLLVVLLGTNVSYSMTQPGASGVRTQDLHYYATMLPWAELLIVHFNLMFFGGGGCVFCSFYFGLLVYF